MACFKNTGTASKPKYVRDEEKSTTPNLHGSSEAFKKAQVAEPTEVPSKTSKTAPKADKGA